MNCVGLALGGLDKVKAGSPVLPGSVPNFHR